MGCLRVTIFNLSPPLPRTPFPKDPSMAEQTQGTQNQYNDPLDRFWNLYLLDADKEAARMAERWKGDADGILIFTGLFATTVGSFIIATYPNLQQNSADQSAATLLVVTQQLSQITQLLASSGSPVPQSPLNITTLETFAATPAAIKVNILWILSFFMSLFCALLATLVQQWSRTYIGDTQRRGSPRTRGAIHSFLRVGVERFGFNHAVDAIITLLHLSVLLFTAGFLVFMFDINDLVARTLLGAMIGASVLYLVMTVLPAVFLDCPYSTPLSLVIRVLAGSLSVAASRIIERQFPGVVVEDRAYNPLSRSYHIFKRLSLPGRQHAFDLCRTERSYQRPAHVLNQMVASINENDEIFEFVTSLPYYIQTLRDLRFDEQGQFWPQFSYQEKMQSFLYQLPKYFNPDPTSNPSHVLTPRKTEELPRLVLLANAAGVEKGDLNAIVSPEGRRIDTQSGMRVGSCLTTQNSSSWSNLIFHPNPVVFFLSYCLLCSVYVLDDYGDNTLEDTTLFEHFIGGPLTASYELSVDKLLSSLARCGYDYISIYRLLFFIRVVLHYSALPENPVAAHRNIWVPVLQGLRDLTMKLDFDRVSHGAGVAIWRVFSIIGRDDLIPSGALEFQDRYRGRRLDYSYAFKLYPVAGDALDQLANALMGRRGDAQIRRRASTPALMQIHDGHAKAGDSGRGLEGPRNRPRKYSLPTRRKSVAVLPKLDDPRKWSPYLRSESRNQENLSQAPTSIQDNSVPVPIQGDPVPAPVQDVKDGTSIGSRLRRLVSWQKRSKVPDEEAIEMDSLNNRPWFKTLCV